jgi:hypothetical protein
VAAVAALTRIAGGAPESGPSARKTMNPSVGRRPPYPDYWRGAWSDCCSRCESPEGKTMEKPRKNTPTAYQKRPGNEPQTLVWERAAATAAVSSRPLQGQPFREQAKAAGEGGSWTLEARGRRGEGETENGWAGPFWGRVWGSWGATAERNQFVFTLRFTLRCKMWSNRKWDSIWAEQEIQIKVYRILPARSNGRFRLSKVKIWQR